MLYNPKVEPRLGLTYSIPVCTRRYEAEPLATSTRA